MLWKIRKFWAWLTHRHNYDIIFRGVSIRPVLNPITREFEKTNQPIIMERCPCGHERAWEITSTKRFKIDTEWVRGYAHINGQDIIDR